MNQLNKMLVFVFLGVSQLSYSQQGIQYTQYLDNMLFYNPAYAGSRDMMNFTALHRQQWVGFEGAPMSSSLSMHSPLKYDNLGLGFSFLNDRIGPINRNWINLDFSYSLKFKKHDGRLSFGLKGGLNMLNGDIAALTKYEQNDDVLNVRLQNEITPRFGAGIYYHSKRWFMGLSIPQINDGNSDFLEQRHYYFSVGGYINASRMLKIRPSVMLKVTDNAPFALDGSLAFIFYDKLWLGVNYRLEESFGIIAQLQISNQFKVGYGFDLSTTKLMGYNYGSHEILLSYDLLFKQKSINSPRYF